MSCSGLLNILYKTLAAAPKLSTIYRGSNVISRRTSLNCNDTCLFKIVFAILAIRVVAEGTSAITGARSYIRSEPRDGTVFNNLLRVDTMVILNELLNRLAIPCIGFSLNGSNKVLYAKVLVKCLADGCLGYRHVLGKRRDVVQGLKLILFFINGKVPTKVRVGGGFSIISVLINVVLAILPVTMNCLIYGIVLHGDGASATTVVSNNVADAPTVNILDSGTNMPCSGCSFACINTLATVIVLFEVVWGWGG